MLASSRRVLVRTAGRSVRAVRRDVVRQASTEATSTSTVQGTPITSPPKNPRLFRRVLILTSLLGVVFYSGSTLVAFNSERYHDFFVESVPLGEAIVEYIESQGWDKALSNDVLRKTVDVSTNATQTVGGAITRTFGSSPSPPTPIPKESKKERIQEHKEKLKSVGEVLKTKVERITPNDPLIPGLENLKNSTIKFSDDVAELVRKAEDALRGKFEELSAMKETSVVTPSAAAVDAATTSSSEMQTSTPSLEAPPLDGIPAGPKIYTNALPLGHEPPPGFVRPPPPKPSSPKPTPKEEPVPSPEPAIVLSLPLVAPAVSELSASEPIIAQLASSIDTLTTFLADQPTIASSAKEVIEAAQADLLQLGDRLHKAKEEEQKLLEEKLDEQARVYTTKLLELELDAQDKIDAQEEGWKSTFEEERTKIVDNYRQKLEAQLQAQTEIINQRLKEEVIAQGIELQRRWIREIKVRVEQERGGRLAKLDDLATGLKRLERVTLDNSSYLEENLRLHGLWSAFRALHSAVQGPTRKPFREELRVLRQVAAAQEDPVILTALDSLERTDIPDIGVEPLPDLAFWLNTSVTPRVSSVALVPDQNAGVLSHIASSMLSTFRFRRHGLVDGGDALSILSRAEYYMDVKDLDAAARELNQLKGWPKTLTHDWLGAARRRLEVEQALEIVQAQATLASLLVV